ncbi:hypothetical protein BH18ACT17_BH18ACT17_07430 [soil metagenome]
MSDVIETVIERMAGEDVEAARAAEAALEWMTGGENRLELLTQERVQRFLWYELPMKWLTDTDHHRLVVASLTRALDLLDLPRYAAICGSSISGDVLNAYSRSDREGKRAFLDAQAASGISPPDLPEFVWGSVMGPEESRALSSTAELLELAIAGGELVLGAPRWKAQQQTVTRDHLTLRRAELEGRTLMDAVESERRQQWLERSRSPSRRGLIAPLAGRIRSPVTLPSGADDPLPTLRWLLEQLVEGQPLTQTGNLNRAFVQTAAQRFAGWRPPLGPPRGEDDVYELQLTRELASRLRLVRRSGKKLLLTTKGRSLLADPDRLWRAAAHAVLPDHSFDRATGEITLAVLGSADTVGYQELNEKVAKVIREEGWHEQRSDDAPDGHQISISMHRTTNLLRALALYTVDGDWRDRRYGLTEVGTATALEALHHAATGPRFHILG